VMEQNCPPYIFWSGGTSIGLADPNPSEAQPSDSDRFLAQLSFSVRVALPAVARLFLV